MNFSLRDFIRRIAWRRVIIIFTSLFLVYYYYTHKYVFRMLYAKGLLFWHTITRPFYSIGDIFHGSHSEVFDLCVICAVLITIIAIIKVLRQKRWNK